jgi:hypothetical protein
MRIVPTILTTALLAACAGATARRGPADEAADRAALLRLHEQHRAAHFDRRADLLVASQADTLLSVSGGRISASPRVSVRASFKEYFDNSTFQAWDDVTPPRIRISADGMMAYVIVDKRVHVTSTTPGAAPVVERVRYAWLSVYEKRGGEWRLTAIASTDRPDST